MAYQSFPWQHGDSHSFEKLKQLYLPALAGKSLLDVGCNTGFFCGYASFSGAEEVVGIDNNPTFVAQAKRLFPKCSFYCMNWEALDARQYDVILFISALHYASDQKAMLDFLMSRLKPDGMLVLELGIAPGEENCFAEVTRSIDTRMFPTRAKLESMLAGRAYKYICQSIPQRGDPIPRFVYHIQNLKPVAVLLMDEHYSGKTSFSGNVFEKSLCRLSGDAILCQIAENRIDAPPELKSAIGRQQMNLAETTQTICEAGQLHLLCDIFRETINGRGVILDMYIPPEYREEMRAYWSKAGFFVADVTLYSALSDPWSARLGDYDSYSSYLDFLKSNFLIDEADYLAANPDVAQAVAEGRLPSGQYHYWNFGRREKRRTRPDKT